MFIGLLVAVFEVTLFLFAQMNLQNAAVQAGRLIMTGQVQNAGTSQANFLTSDVCPLLGPMFTCSNVYANVQAYTNFSSANTSEPTLTFGSNGAVNNSWSYSLGSPGQVMVVQLIYQWPIISGPLGAVLPNIGNGYAEMMGVTAFRIEPY
jgi:Flp pilus assembly protein TadG